MGAGRSPGEDRMIRRLWLGLSTSWALLLLAGCGGEVGMAFAGASVASFATTDKFLTDHAVSYAMDEDCSSLQLEQTGQYCRSKEEIAAAEAEPAGSEPLYCYRTLAEITCYEHQDFQASSARIVR